MSLTPQHAQVIFCNKLLECQAGIYTERFITRKMRDFDATVTVLATSHNPEDGLTLEASWLGCQRRIEALGWHCTALKDGRLRIKYSVAV
jgi:hypothetical protein